MWITDRQAGTVTRVDAMTGDASTSQRLCLGPVGVTAPPEAFRVADPQLQPGAGVQAPAAGSPAIDGATEIFPFVMEDIDGQPRDQPDLGADELSSAPRIRRPLTPADVGPDAP